MATLLKFDEANKLSSKKKNKSIPYEQYFGEMELTDEQKKERIELANEMEEVFAYVFAMMKTDYLLGNDIDKERYSEMLSRRYLDCLITFKIIDNVLNKRDKYQNEIVDYIDDICPKIIDSTINSKEDSYSYSADRTKYVSESETNTIMNTNDFAEAKRNGYKRKQWVTQKDSKVRNTHRYVDDEIIGIDDMFDVGGCQMAYPRDPRGNSEEIQGCRCTIRYFK